MRLEEIFHNEQDIPSDFISEVDADETQCYINNFEFVNVKTMEMKSVEDIGVDVYLYGYLINSNTKHSSSIDQVNVSKPNSFGFASNFFVKVVELGEWTFCKSDPKDRGVWVKSKMHWYKLIQPSPEYRATFEPFERKCLLWFALRDICSQWMEQLDQILELETEDLDLLNDFKQTLTWDFVIGEISALNYGNDDMVRHSSFILDRILLERTFSTMDFGENEIAKTPFFETLILNSQSSTRSKKARHSSQEQVLGKRGKYVSSTSEECPLLPEDEISETKKKKLANIEYSYTTKPGEPTAEELLDMEYSPTLIANLTARYPAGISATGMLNDLLLLRVYRMQRVPKKKSNLPERTANLFKMSKSRYSV